MSIQNATINSYYRSAKAVALLESDPKVAEYLRAVKAKKEAREIALAEMVKQEVTKTSGKSTYRKYEFGDIVVTMRTTITHINPVPEHDEPRDYLTID